MEPTNIIQILNQIPGFSNSVSLIIGSIITAVFLRRNTQAQEFEKIKANKFAEVANDLLESGKMTLTEYYKTKNFLKIAEMADSMVQEKEITQLISNIALIGLLDIMKHPEILVIKKCKFYGPRY